MLLAVAVAVAVAECGPVRWLIEAAVAHDPAAPVRSTSSRVLRVARPRERRNRAGAYASYREGHTGQVPYSVVGQRSAAQRTIRDFLLEGGKGKKGRGKIRLDSFPDHLHACVALRKLVDGEAQPPTQLWAGMGMDALLVLLKTLL